MTRHPRLLVWPQGEVWRWTYEEPSANGSGPFRLDSSIAFPDAQEARSAAEVAFPGVPVGIRQGDVPERGGPDRGGPAAVSPREALVVDVLLAAAVGVAVLMIPRRGQVARAVVVTVRQWLATALEQAATTTRTTPRGTTTRPRIRTAPRRVARR